MNSQEISNVFRLGRQTENKNRPVLVSITTQWKKHLILKNKANLPSGINVKEDFSKETLEKRKQLQPQVEEEKKKGNIAYIKFDKLIVIKPKDNAREKRKRETSSSPNSSPSLSLQKKGNNNETLRNPEPSLPKTYAKEIIRPNILNYVERTRSDPQLATQKTQKTYNCLGKTEKNNCNTYFNIQKQSTNETSPTTACPRGRVRPPPSNTKKQNTYNCNFKHKNSQSRRKPTRVRKSPRRH